MEFCIQVLNKEVDVTALHLGFKKDIWMSINPDTGVHQETVSPQTVDSCPIGHKPETVFIGRTEYKIVMTDTKHSSRLWNATFVDFSSHLLPGKLTLSVRVLIGFDSKRKFQSYLVDTDYQYQHFHSSADGRIVTFDSLSKKMLWKVDLKSVIVNMYLLKKDGMHKLPSTSVAKTTYEAIEEVSSFRVRSWTDTKLTLNSNEELLGRELSGYYP